MSEKDDDPRDLPEAPPGWAYFDVRGHFGDHAGPFCYRKDGPGVGFWSRPHHGNLQGMIHGGMLLTLADNALFNITWCEIGKFRGVTIFLNSQFVAPGPVGKFIEATGEVVRAGGSLVFVRGRVLCEGETLLAFDGGLKRFKPKD